MNPALLITVAAVGLLCALAHDCFPSDFQAGERSSAKHLATLRAWWNRKRKP
jgi:hypothetical protein